MIPSVIIPYPGYLYLRAQVLGKWLQTQNILEDKSNQFLGCLAVYTRLVDLASKNAGGLAQWQVHQQLLLVVLAANHDVIF